MCACLCVIDKNIIFFHYNTHTHSHLAAVVVVVSNPSMYQNRQRSHLSCAWEVLVQVSRAEDRPGQSCGWTIFEKALCVLFVLCFCVYLLGEEVEERDGRGIGL